MAKKKSKKKPVQETECGVCGEKFVLKDFIDDRCHHPDCDSMLCEDCRVCCNICDRNYCEDHCHGHGCI